tara:strand:- start:1079 stop:1279 length:201 start_codon:yes stop_codon:yes gene_type:complete
MFKLFVIAILIINSIFWGFYPVSEMSPHMKIINYLGIKIDLGVMFHIILGLLFYLLAAFISHSIII